MGKVIRFGISLEEELLEAFDRLCTERSYKNRSEAVRDLIRSFLLDKKWDEETECSAATLTLVYDHHKNNLSKRLTELQHDDFDIIVTTMHVHLDHNNCLEVLVIKGDPKRIKSLASKLISCKGVKHGFLCKTSTGDDLM